MLSQIRLAHFRNFIHADFTFGTHLTLIVGDNAKGKTSLLEAIHTAVYGTGFRQSREVELIHWNADDCIVDVQFKEDDTNFRFQVRLTKINTDRVHKTYYVNKTSKSAVQYAKNQTQAVLFAPEQIRIITGSPSRKRNYFDSVISAVDPLYKKALHSYEHALRRRNKVLEQYEDPGHLHEELFFWNQSLIENGAFVSQKRTDYVRFLNEHPNVDGKKFRAEYHKDAFSQARLERMFEKEMRFRRTLIGPQKDDFVLFLDGKQEKNISLYGSRSEQRMAVFWLKLNELAFFQRESDQKPLLLLDDIFSELDGHNRELIMKMIKNHQTITTTTEHEVEDLAEMPEVVIEL